jgi:hypothetical protein
MVELDVVARGPQLLPGIDHAGERRLVQVEVAGRETNSLEPQPPRRCRLRDDLGLIPVPRVDPSGEAFAASRTAPDANEHGVGPREHRPLALIDADGDPPTGEDFGERPRGPWLDHDITG